MNHVSFLAAAVAVAMASTAFPVQSKQRTTERAVSVAGRTADWQRAPRCRLIEAQAFDRIELFFGLSRPGGVVTEAEFSAFVDASVTPRFPDGLTVVSANGQFRDAGGTIVVEGSKMLILLVPRTDREADAKVQAIRDEYRQAFQQQSVLRTDAVACVSF
jgi:Protein of unknown function (DUF3574)